MDKVIRDIVDVDLECSKRVAEAKKKKQDIQLSMTEQKKKIYDSFIEEYQVKIDARKQELQERIQQTKIANEKEYETSLHQLSTLYNDRKDEWIDTIVQHCKEI